MSGPSQADVFAALQAQDRVASTRPKAETTALGDHQSPEQALTNGTVPTNATRIHCFRQQCGSLILLPGAAEWVEAAAGLVSGMVPRQLEGTVRGRRLCQAPSVQA